MKRGRPLRYALLTADQALYVANLSRNTNAVADFELALVVAFVAARRAPDAACLRQPAWKSWSRCWQRRRARLPLSRS